MHPQTHCPFLCCPLKCANWQVASASRTSGADRKRFLRCVAANLTFDGTEGRWKALQASEIYELRAYLSEVYRNALAREARALGYEIENQRDTKGRDSGFEIRGVPQELLAKFSQRSRQRDAAIAVF